MGKPNKKPLDKQTGKRILRLFESFPEWFPAEAPLETTSILGLVRPQDTISIWISGSSSNPQLAFCVENVIAGIDVLTHEQNPNSAKNEPSGNAYHYILQEITDNNFPYVLYGPYKSGTMIPHWFNVNDLNVYLKYKRK
ncbi:hypothetical protein CO110_04080 [Candidatus Desantisbacteria bacterium CG_4_9_14_3_um_filter_40_11]|uniref:Uncharacterized protein n=1 Tax=Candidatus Desantisbacteria bacterium CG_4_9_14_3_um_filter_40_11 TaxID=1974546 RepID=A0A2M8AU97_9BACT|nr:MAG: hypothetical protein CO110_04080 [Candidatus Desantisbacteria bacterium CG_4_9_14_3_um_filter_40_11]